VFPVFKIPMIWGLDKLRAARAESATRKGQQSEKYFESILKPQRIGGETQLTPKVPHEFQSLVVALLSAHSTNRAYLRYPRAWHSLPSFALLHQPASGIGKPVVVGRARPLCPFVAPRSRSFRQRYVRLLCLAVKGSLKCQIAFFVPG
jgi:hypothetical protein